MSADRVRAILREHKVANRVWEEAAIEEVVQMEREGLVTVDDDGTLAITDKGRETLGRGWDSA